MIYESYMQQSDRLYILNIDKDFTVFVSTFRKIKIHLLEQADYLFSEIIADTYISLNFVEVFFPFVASIH
jgi:hypothetical protein